MKLKLLLGILLIIVLVLISGCSKVYNPSEQICDMTCGERKELGIHPDIQTPSYDKFCFDKEKGFCEDCCLYWHDWKEIEDTDYGDKTITRFKLYSARFFLDGGGYYMGDLDCKIEWEEDMGIIYHYMECYVERVNQDDVIAKHGKIDYKIQISEVE